jgi:hypothetical protein
MVLHRHGAYWGRRFAAPTRRGRSVRGAARRGNRATDRCVAGPELRLRVYRKRSSGTAHGWMATGSAWSRESRSAQRSPVQKLPRVKFVQARGALAWRGGLAGGSLVHFRMDWRRHFCPVRMDGPPIPYGPYHRCWLCLIYSYPKIAIWYCLDFILE